MLSRAAVAVVATASAVGEKQRHRPVKNKQRTMAPEACVSKD